MHGQGAVGQKVHRLKMLRTMLVVEVESALVKMAGRKIVKDKRAEEV